MKAGTHQQKSENLKNEIISDIRLELSKNNASEVELTRSIVIEEIDDQFSNTVERITNSGIISSLEMEFNGEESEVTDFKELSKDMLIAILKELESNRFEVIEDLETE